MGGELSTQNSGASGVSYLPIWRVWNRNYLSQLVSIPVQHLAFEACGT